MPRSRTKLLLSIACLLSFNPVWTVAQDAASSNKNADDKLKFVVYLSRHGVRSPTGLPTQYNSYSIAPWPTWDVPPGYLTPHGYQLMKLFGGYDRMELAHEGLLAESGCADASKVTF